MLSANVKLVHCPYCGNRVDAMRPHLIRKPPDERDEPPPVSREERSADSPGTAALPEPVECQYLAPCGHLFRNDDIEAVADGDLSVTDLGVRVQNPVSTVM